MENIYRNENSLFETLYDVNEYVRWFFTKTKHVFISIVNVNFKYVNFVDFSLLGVKKRILQAFNNIFDSKWKLLKFWNKKGE